MTFTEVTNLLSESPENSYKGQRFEYIIRRWFQADPVFSAHFKEVWLWSDFPGAKTHDVGIDIVALTDTDQLAAVQCKFYKKTSKVQLDDGISNFIAAATAKVFGITFQQKRA